MRRRTGGEESAAVSEAIFVTPRNGVKTGARGPRRRNGAAKPETGSRASQFAGAAGPHARTNQPAPKLIDAERSQIQPPIGISPRIPPVCPVFLSLSLCSPPFRIRRRSLSGARRCRSTSRSLAGPDKPAAAASFLRQSDARVQGRLGECSAAGCPAMDWGERLGRALDAFGGDLWALVDAALNAAARDRPEELRARRDGIVERLYATAAAGCSKCDGRPPPRAVLAAAGLDEEEEGGHEAAPASPVVETEADAHAGAAEELGAGDGEAGLESKIVAIRDLLEDPNQHEDELVSLLQNLADMDVTCNALQETDIGRQVNFLRKHSSAEVRRLVKQLIRKWKEIVDDWVRLHNSGGNGSASVTTADGDSPDKIQGRSHQSSRVSGSQYSPSPQRQNASASERASNGFEPTIDAKRRASPVPAHHNSRQMNNNHHSTTTTTASSAPAFSCRK